MRNTRKALIAAALGLTLTATHAQFIDGNRLHEWFTGEVFQQTAATTYVLGVYDTARGTYICPPDSVRLRASQVSDMVKLNLARLPAERSVDAHLFVIATLGAQWPCPTKKGGSL